MLKYLYVHTVDGDNLAYPLLHEFHDLAPGEPLKTEEVWKAPLLSSEALELAPKWKRGFIDPTSAGFTLALV